MPSAANVKIDKQISPENALADPCTSSMTPIRQGITIVEHKIRNLEKRKVKLESYRELQNSGKDLNQDQKTAVARYDEVVQTLEFARDLCKQFLGIAVTTEKEAKKLARKEAVARSQGELAKIREVLLVQDALNQMGQDNIREDFLVGRNGAAALTSSDLKLLDDLYPAVTPKHEPGDPTAFTNQVQGAAEHLLAVVDGKPKDAFGGTYSQIKEVIGKVHESGYLDQALESEFEEAVEVADVSPSPVMEPPQLSHQDTIPTLETLEVEPTRPPPPMEAPDEQVPAEQIFYQQPSRPITEVLGTGSFFFLQDSELDTPDTLPTQTFTNTSFVQVPPPIPMPPSYPVFPNAPPTGNGIEEAPIEPEEAPKQQQPQRTQPRSNGNQNYYQNNNYNNRPRQNRNGPRTTGNRQNQ